MIYNHSNKIKVIKPNILVLCGKNKKRSRTAEFIFKNNAHFNIRSAGLSPKSERKVSAKDIVWADLIFVMESDQKEKLKDLYKNLQLPSIENLDVPDEYDFMDPELIEILTDRMNESIEKLLFP